MVVLSNRPARISGPRQYTRNSSSSTVNLFTVENDVRLIGSGLRQTIFLTAYLAFNRGPCQIRSSKRQYGDTLPDSHLLNVEVRRPTTRRLDVCGEMGPFASSKGFGESVALTFESNARGRSPYPMPSKGPCGPRA
jgi:hypothetical protein